MLLVMRVLSIVPLNLKVRHSTTLQLDTNSLTMYASLIALGSILESAAAGMVSTTFPGTSCLQFFHSIAFPFPPDASGSHHT